MTSNHKYDAVKLEEWATQIFASCGLAADHAATTAAILVRTEARGYTTHGVVRMPSYVERLHKGIFNPRPKMTHRSFPGGIAVDADGAMGQVAASYAVSLGQAALDNCASVLIAVGSCGHLGALGIYALQAADAGAFCMIGQRTPPALAMPGFIQPAIGDNPIAFGCPCPGTNSVVFDMACSIVAGGHIRMAAQAGQAISEDWAVGPNGSPTTDPKLALQGALLPVGGHKGIGIAMMVECLAGAMTASASSLSFDRNVIPEGGAPGRQSAFLWMAKPTVFTLHEYFAEYMTQWTNSYLAAGSSNARIPGQRSAKLERLAFAQGITLSKIVENELTKLGSRVGVPFASNS
jgi:LDH2 family malate/lactate/ureidoglycolate dehydrogenase